MIDGWGISCEIVLTWTPQDLTDDKSTLVQVMAWCRQATSHYLSKCWPRFMSPYGVTRLQWVNESVTSSIHIHFKLRCYPCPIQRGWHIYQIYIWWWISITPQGLIQLPVWTANGSHQSPVPRPSPAAGWDGSATTWICSSAPACVDSVCISYWVLRQVYSASV